MSTEFVSLENAVQLITLVTTCEFILDYSRRAFGMKELGAIESRQRLTIN